MSELTPVEKLEKAINEYYESTRNDNSYITGWVLNYQAFNLNTDPKYGDVNIITSYTCGTATSPALIIGLNQATTIRMEKILWIASNDEEEDNE